MPDAPTLTARPREEDPAAAELADALEGVPMLAGLVREELLELTEVLRPLELAPGDVLWRQGTAVTSLYILLEGELRMGRRLPGEREFEVHRSRAGMVAGALLLGRGRYAATARAAAPCSVVRLDGEDFRARMRIGRPGALSLKRRIIEDACTRARADHALMARTIDPAGAHPPADAGPAPCVPCRRPIAMPAVRYAARLPFFAGMPPAAVDALLAAGEALEVDPGCVVLGEGGRTDRCYVVLAGAVEDVVARGDRAVRVRFAGPGRAVGLLGHFDGRPATAASVARERTILLALGADDVARWMRDRDETSLAFTAAVEADLMATLAATASAKGRLAQEEAA